MVNTIKFSEMTDGGDLNNNDKVPGILSGGNVLFNNPWVFLPPGTTAQRPPPSETINYRLRFNTDVQLYEYYDNVLGAWTQLQESLFTEGPYIIYTEDATLPDAQNLGALANGILRQTISSGVATLDIAVNGVNYYGPGFVIPGSDGGTGINNDGLTINLSGGTAGYVMVSDAFGNGTWNSIGTTGVITEIDGDTGSALPSSGIVVLTGGATGLTFSGSGNSLFMSGILESDNGGTGINNGALTINLGSATLGYVLTSDASGNATWQHISASGAISTINGDSGSAAPVSGIVVVTGSTTGLIFTGSGNTLSLGGTLSPSNGGTGVNNGSSKIMIGGNTEFSGAFDFTGTLTNTTTITFPTSGTLATTAATVPSLQGTANQVLVNGTSGSPITGTAITLTTPQNIDTSSSFQVNTLGVGGASNTNAAITVLTDKSFNIYLNGITTSQVSPDSVSVGIFENHTIQPASSLIYGVGIASQPVLSTSSAAITNGYGIFSAPTKSGANTLSNLYGGFFSQVSGAATVNIALYAYDMYAGSSNQFHIDPSGNVTASTLTLGSPLTGANGGTGVANTGKTITIGGNVTFSGAFTFTGTLTGNTSVTFPTSGTLLSSSGSLTTGSVLFASGGLISQDNSNFFWDGTNHNLGLNTNTLNSSAVINVGGTKGVLIYDTSVKNGSISGVQTGHYDTCTYASASSYSQVATIFSAPLVSVASGQTVTNFASFISQPIVTSNVGTISKGAGFMFLAGGTSGGTGTLTALYGGYFETPLSGTAKAGVYAGNAAIGYAATSPPASGLIVSGNTSIGSSSAASLFNVGSSNQFQIGTTGIVTSGTWNASIITGTYGGTGVNNGSSTITLGGSLTTSGAFSSTFTMTNTTSVTFPTSGTLATVGGSVVSIQGTANQVLVNGTSGSAVTGTAITLTTPQSIGTSSTPTFGGLTLTSPLTGANGGTGVNNGSSTITVGGNVVYSGAFSTTFTVTNTTSLTLPTSGTVLSTANASGNYVSSITGTANQVIASASTGSVTLSLPQSIATSSTPTFGGATLNGTVDINYATPVFTITNTSSNGRLKFTCDTSINYIQSGLTSSTSSAAPLVFANMNNGTEWARFDSSGNFLLGTSTQATSTKLTVSSSTQANSRVTLSGQEFWQAANTSTDGIALLCGVNRSGNRQLWIADSAKLTQNSTNQVLRLSNSFGGGDPHIDAVATDGTTPLKLTLQNGGGDLICGGTVQFNSNASNGTTATVLGSLGPAGSHTTVQGWIVIKNSSGTTGWIPYF